MGVDICKRNKVKGFYFFSKQKAFNLRILIYMATMIENQSIRKGQEEEINALREHFKDNIRILSSIGQFSYILKIRADQYDVSLTLQLDRKFSKKN